MPPGKLERESELVNILIGKGIEFNLIKDFEAITFLENSNYYTKISSFRHNFNKIHNPGKPNDGKYKNIDFFHLKDLSTIDMHLRNVFIKMALSLEHSMKTEFLNKISKIKVEDGYRISKHYFKNNIGSAKRLFYSLKSSYCSELINKYDINFASQNNTQLDTYIPNIPVWVLCEAISFGDFIKLTNSLEKMYRSYKMNYAQVLPVIKDFRNAIAHNNCIINNLLISDQKPISYVNSRIKKYSLDFDQELLKNRQFHNIISFLIAFNEYEKSQEVKDVLMGELKHLLNNRVIRNKVKYINISNSNSNNNNNVNIDINNKNNTNNDNILIYCYKNLMKVINRF